MGRGACGDSRCSRLTWRYTWQVGVESVPQQGVGRYMAQ